MAQNAIPCLELSRKKENSDNGYILKLADRYNIEAPYNRIVYNLSKKMFRKKFQPMDVTEILGEVKKII